jgi:hypothetical protein
MNESNIPRDWWVTQDQDEAWMQQLEDELKRREEEERKAPKQLELPFDELTDQELEAEYDAFMARLEKEGKQS